MKKITHIPNNVTIGEKYVPAMKITDPKEARDYFLLCVEHTMAVGKKNRREAEEIEKANLGYYAGYCCRKTRERVERLFNCSHPIFGPISEGEPTAQETLDAGKRLATESFSLKS